MGFSFNQDSSNTSKRFKFFASTLKDAFASCHSFRKNSHSSAEEDDPMCDYDNEDEVFVSAVISKYMELKCRRKTNISTEKFTWAFSPTTGDLFISARLKQKEDHEDQEKEESEDFYSVASRLSPCSSSTSFEAFVTAKTIFSPSSTLDRIDFQDLWRHLLFRNSPTVKDGHLDYTEKPCCFHLYQNHHLILGHGARVLERLRCIDCWHFKPVISSRQSNFAFSMEKGC